MFHNPVSSSVLLILISIRNVSQCLDFDVVLIGFRSDQLECIGERDRMGWLPSVLWHRVERVGKGTGGHWRNSVGSKYNAPCFGGLVGNNDALVKEVITNATIMWTVRNYSRLICIGISQRYWPGLTWKTQNDNKQMIINEVSWMGSAGHIVMSILQIDHIQNSYKCEVDEFKTCSVREQRDKKMRLHVMAEQREYENVNSTFILAAMRTVVKSGEDWRRLYRLVYPKWNGSLCREDCYRLQFTYPNVWALLDNATMVCRELPSVTDTARSCWQSQKNPWRSWKVSKDCYRPHDRHYVGLWNRTIDGAQCQRWDTLCPHYHEYRSEIYPELVNSENYCRNPDGLRKMPWCLTVDGVGSFSYCTGIPPYSQLTTDPPVSISRNGSPLITVIVIGMVLVLAIGLVYLLGRKRWPVWIGRVRKGRPTGDIGLFPSAQSDRTDQVCVWDVPLNDLYFRNEGGMDRRLERMEVDRSNWSVVRKVASTEYSLVCLAKLRTSRLAERLVIVKTLKEPCQSWKFDNFVQEARLAASCNHTRIVRCLGVCFITRPSSILFEYVSLGDLRSVLEAEMEEEHEDTVNRLEMLRKQWQPPLRHPKRQIDICYQIADGMVYLANQSIIHRDLAARNVLVDDRLQVKISDFGMARRVAEIGGIYVGSDCEHLPVRWTAPEAWSAHLFSSKSDVWSYGVLVWEILSYGQQPYAGLSHQQVVRMVVDDKKCLQPSFGRFEEDRAGEMTISGRLMSPCFAYDPQDRPDFISLLSAATRLRFLFSSDPIHRRAGLEPAK